MQYIQRDVPFLEKMKRKKRYLLVILPIIFICVYLFTPTRPDSLSLNTKFVTHRGARQRAPENTIHAFHLALQSKGVSIVETDVRQTLDGYWVIAHDYDLNRTTNGTGLVEESTFEYLQSLDWGSWFSEEFSGTKVLTLKEALLFFKEYNGSPMLEFKGGDPVLFLQYLMELEDEGLLDKDKFILFSLNLKYTEDLSDSVYYDNVITKEEEKGGIVEVRWRNGFSCDVVESLHAKGKKVFINLMRNDTIENIQLSVKCGIDYVMTESLHLLDQIVRK